MTADNHTEPNPGERTGKRIGERLRWFVRRVLCAVYDGLIVIALFIFFTAVLMPFTGGAIEPPPYNIAFDIYLAIIGIGYFVLVWRRDGQTLGMRAWKIRVVTPDGELISGRAAVIRAIVGFTGWLCLGLGWLWILIDPQGRAWQDIASNTKITRVQAKVQAKG